MMIRTGDECGAGRGFISLPSVFDDEYKGSESTNLIGREVDVSVNGDTTGAVLDGSEQESKACTANDKETDEASAYLRQVVASLVNLEKIEDAVQLCHHYSFWSIDVEIVRVCMSVSKAASHIFSVNEIQPAKKDSIKFEVEIAPTILDLERSRTAVDISLLY